MKKPILFSISLLGFGLLNACGGAAGANNGVGVSTGSQPAVTHFSVTTAASAIPGTPINFTVTALNSSNSVVSTYSGTVHFTSTDSQAILPPNSMLTNGTGTFSATLKTVGIQTITSTDTVNARLTGTSNAISVTGPATHLSLTAPESASAGVAFQVKVTAQDASNNTVTAYSGTIHFTSTDGSAVLPQNCQLTNGTGTFSATMETVGNQTITATDTVTASITGTSNPIEVAAQNALTITTGSLPAGTVGTPYGTPIEVDRSHYNVFQLKAQGGTGSYNFSWVAAAGSAIPPGLQCCTLESGGSTRCCVFLPNVIYGTPQVAGSYSVVLTVTDSASPPAKASANYTIVIDGPASAEAKSEVSSANQGVRYKLVDLGTLGGPNSYLPAFYVFETFTPQALSADGTFAGWADTPDSDPYAPNDCFFDCYVDRAFTWKHGVRTPLPALSGPAGLSAASTWISSNGLIVGFSENGEFDPFLDYPAAHGVLWRNEQIVDLKTIEGGYESLATAVNSSGQVVGFASNTTYDPNSIQFAPGAPMPTQTRAFLWQNGVMTDLNTLGGTDAEAFYINEQGQIVGQSYTADAVPNPVPHCADSPLTLHAFIWRNDKMTDLETLGGSCTFAYALNNRGQVVGQSNLMGDEYSHPYIWDRGTMTDLHTLGGGYGYAAWLNNSGEVVGASSLEGDQALLAFYWKDGAMKNLGTANGDPCSFVDAINSSGQMVGGSGGFSTNGAFPACEVTAVEHAVLWENGQVIDLNVFVPSSSDLTLNEAVFINDGGEISGFATLPSGDQHVFLLIPCGGDQAGAGECDSSVADSTTGVSLGLAEPPLRSVSGPAFGRTPNRLRGMLSRQGRRFGTAPPSTN